MPEKSTAAPADMQLPASRLRANELCICVLKVYKDYAVVRLWPRVEAVRRALGREYGGYAVRHYACGRALYCGVGVALQPGSAEYVYRDACPPPDYRAAQDTAQDECDGSFLAAAALWGVGDAVLRMPSMRLPAEKVQINPVAARDGRSIQGYELAETLTVDEIAYEGDEVTVVQLLTKDGRKLIWQRH